MVTVPRLAKAAVNASAPDTRCTMPVLVMGSASAKLLLPVATTTVPAFDERVRRIIASLRGNRHALATMLLQNLADWEKYANQIRAHYEDLDAYVKLEFYVFIDYLTLLLSTGDGTYRSLYIGEKLKLLHDSTLSPEQDDAKLLKARL